MKYIMTDLHETASPTLHDYILMLTADNILIPFASHPNIND